MARGEILASGRTPGLTPSLWRNTDFVLLWSGQVVSLVGTGISQLAFPLLVLAITRSPAQAGLMGASRLIPFLLLSLPAGALVDRWDRKRTMILCDAGRALVLASIPLAIAMHRLTLGQLYLISLAEGTLFVFYNLASTACLPRVVPKGQFPTAMALNEGSYSLSLLLGPPLGGLLWNAGHALPFLVDALSYAASVGTIVYMRLPFQGARAAAARALRTEIAEGFVWVWRQPVIRFMILLTGGHDFIYPGTTLILILLAQGRHAPPVAIGLILAAGGVGGGLGALLYARIQRRFRFGRIIRVSSWLYVLVWPLFAIAPNPLALALVFGAFVSVDTIYNITQYSYRLALIPDALQGRVNSVSRLIFFSLQSLGLAATGILLERAGAVRTVLIEALLLVALAVAAALSRAVGAAPPAHAAAPR